MTPDFEPDPGGDEYDEDTALDDPCGEPEDIEVEDDE
jgi:hypothetical protein